MYRGRLRSSSGLCTDSTHTILHENNTSMSKKSSLEDSKSVTASRYTYLLASSLMVFWILFFLALLYFTACTLFYPHETCVHSVVGYLFQSSS